MSQSLQINILQQFWAMYIADGIAPKLCKLYAKLSNTTAIYKSMSKNIITLLEDTAMS